MHKSHQMHTSEFHTIWNNIKKNILHRVRTRRHGQEKAHVDGGGAKEENSHPDGDQGEKSELIVAPVAQHQQSHSSETG